MAADDCFDRLAKETGRPRSEVEAALEALDSRAQVYQQAGRAKDESYRTAGEEMIDEAAENFARTKRAMILDNRKAIARERFYKTSMEAISKLSPKLAVQAARLAMEAKLVGVNLPFFRNRQSVDAQFVALRKLWVGGMARDLSRIEVNGKRVDGLKMFASRQMEKDITDELYELNYKVGKDVRDMPQVGRTKNAEALEIAKVIYKWQRLAMDTLNREGAWIRSYSGYVTRTSHDPFKIAKAGPAKWANDAIEHLDLKRTFGTRDRQHGLDMLYQMWTPMKNGDHFDYGQPPADEIFPNVARKVSAPRELHFKSAAAWRAYNDQYGIHNPTRSIIESLSTGARRAALMKEFGTRPREAYREDMSGLKGELQRQTERQTQRLSALEADQRNQPTSERGEKIQALKNEIEASTGRFRDFTSWGVALDNRFAQIDGTSMKPVNSTMANVVSAWMATQRMAKLGRVALTHFASLPTKPFEARYWGIPFAERYASVFRGLTQGTEESDKRAALNMTLVAFENRLGHMMAQYDVADAPPGVFAKWESMFFKLTGVSSVIDNQRGDAEAMFASHIGGKRGLSWADIGSKEQRVLQGFGIGEAEWKALHGVEWTTLGDKTYLFPADAMKLTDDQVRAYMKEVPSATRAFETLAEDDVAKGREDLALSLATAYSDRAGYAIPMPSARIRAMLFGKNFEPGTPINMALRLLYQFKIWPADMILRQWGREVYGTIGDSRMDRMAGVVEAAVGMIVFGVAAETVREFIQGRDPIKQMENQPAAMVLKGAQRSGFGSLVGDFLLGEFDRHGMSISSNVLGPTIGQLDDLAEFYNAGRSSKTGMFGEGAMRERGAVAIKMAKNNIPFQNLWMTSWLTDYMIWHRLQEWVRPGYLRRLEERQKEQSGQEYWLKPSSASYAR